MQVQGTVVQVSMSKPVKKQDGGTYEAWELIYTSQSGEVKSIAKPVQSLKYNGPLKNVLGSLQAGDNFTMEMDKNKAGFWDVKDMRKGFVDAGEQPSPSLTKAPATTKSTYETAEERAARQVYIIRQSSVANAIALLAANGGKKNSPEEVIAIAKQFEAFVFGKEEASFESFEQDIPA